MTVTSPCMSPASLPRNNRRPSRCSQESVAGPAPASSAGTIVGFMADSGGIPGPGYHRKGSGLVARVSSPAILEASQEKRPRPSGARPVVQTARRSGRLAGERRDPLLERRVGHEKALEAGAPAPGDAEGGHLVGQRSGMALPQALECADHVLPAREPGAARVGAELALAGEPHHDDRGEKTEHQLGNDGRDPERGAVALLVAKHDAVDGVADDPRQEDDE